MSTARSEGGLLAALLLTGAVAGCEALIGADFDVEAAPAGEGGAGGATAGSTSSTGSTTTSTTTGGGDGGGTSSTGAGGCPTDADSIAEGERMPWDVVVDDTHVYWSSPGIPATATNGEIRRRRKDGSDDVEILAAGQAQPNRLLVAGAYLYWTATGTSGSDGAVRFLDRAAAGEVFTAAEGLAVPIGLAAHDGSVFFVDRQDVDVEGTLHMRANRAFLGETTYAPYAAVPRFPTMIAVGEGVLFGGSLEDNDTGVLWTVALDDTQTVASRVNDTGALPDAGLAHGDGAFAVTSVAEGRLDLYNRYGNVVRAGEANTFGAPADVTFADGWFYFAEYGGGTIWRMSTTSAVPECVVTGQPTVNGVAADDERVYFTLHSEGGAVRSVPLPP